MEPFSARWWLAVALLLSAALSVNLVSRSLQRLALYLKLRAVQSLTLANSSSRTRVVVSPFGATLQQLWVTDAQGQLADVLLGYDSIVDYALDASTYFGAVVGRVANRIKGASFDLNGLTYHITQNEGLNHLHGGALGLHKVLWTVVDASSDRVKLAYTSPDNEEGYPGKLEISATYTLSPEGNLSILLEAETDKPTPVNIVQHPYFNLGGHDSGSTIHEHVLTVHAEEFTPKTADGIPTGELLSVDGTPFDFRYPHAIGERQDSPAIVNACYDHNFVLSSVEAEQKEGGFVSRPRLAAILQDPASGRSLELLTNAPGLHLYAGKFVGGQVGKGGTPYSPFSGLALETQSFPDAVHHANFPSTILEPGQRYRHEIVYVFSAEEVKKGEKGRSKKEEEERRSGSNRGRQLFMRRVGGQLLATNAAAVCSGEGCGV